MFEREQELDLQLADLQDELNRMRNKWNADLETLDDLYVELQKAKEIATRVAYEKEYGSHHSLYVTIEELKQHFGILT